MNSIFSGCGIAGLLLFRNEQINSSLYNNFVNVIEALKHRGPENTGTWSNAQLIFGHTRLSIIDLSDRGNQPMTRGKFTIISNGEIYNFGELKSQLEKRRYNFMSETDTEVIIYAYQEWGIDCLKKFNGMFSFAIWDNIKRTLFIARDRLGIKPLYFHCNKDFLIFASEVTALLKFKKNHYELNELTLQDQFLLSSFYDIQNNNTLIKNIYSLPPGSFMTVNAHNDIKINNYWQIPENSSSSNDINVIDELNDLVKSSIEFRLISDVPVSAFLSGGIDSSIINAIACKKTQSKKLKAITISYEGKGNDPFSSKKDTDLEHSKLLSEAYSGFIQHEIINIQTSSFDIKYIDSLIDFASLPDDDRLLSIQQNYKVIKNIGYKIVLNGQGVDEIMGGYVGLTPFYENMFDIQNIQHKANNLLAMVNYPSQKLISNDLIARKDIIIGEIYNFYNYLPGCNAEKIHRFMVHTQLQRILRFEDHLSMQSSVECRVPFLDHRIVEWAFSVPFMSHFDVENRMGKMILRKVAEKYLPDVLTYRPKQAFPKANKEKSYWAMKKIVDEFKSEILNSDIINMLYNTKYLSHNIEKLTNAELWQLIILWRTNEIFNKETQ